MKLLQINTSVNTGSTGRIAEDIGKVLLQHGHESYIAYGHGSRPSAATLIKVGDEWDRYMHGLKSRLLDRHGFGSVNATKSFVNRIEEIQPDLIHLHNIHGYYINIELLFGFLSHADIPVVWTFHDCWPFTGHCSHFEGVNCCKWKTLCRACPNKKGYPASWVLDNSTKNFYDKNVLFNGLSNLHIVSPSRWLASHVKESFLKNYPVTVIHNGIDLNIFKPTKPESVLNKYAIPRKRIILGVANTWKRRKALDDFIQLDSLLDPSILIVLVGLSEKQIKRLPKKIMAIPHTENIYELAALYSAADVFINPTYVDNFPTTNLEALACGTPVITYNTGGSPEAVNEQTGMVVEKGDMVGLKAAVEAVLNNGKGFYRNRCRERAERLYNKDDRNRDYIDLYNSISVR